MKTNNGIKEKTMDFSIVLPTRNNLAGLMNLLQSIDDTTEDLTNVEVLLAVDNDDEQLGSIIENVSKFSFGVKVFPTVKSDYFCRDYFNYLADKSTGNNVLVMNDDCVFLTRGWDNIVREKVKNHSIYMVDMWDSTHEKGGVSAPRFPMLSRDAINTLGFFFYPQVKMWPADLIIWELYSRASAVITCHEVKLQHNHVEESDVTKSRMWKLHVEDVNSKVIPVDTREDIVKIEKAMKRCMQSELPAVHRELLLGCGSRRTKDLFMGKYSDFYNLTTLDNNADHKPDIVYDLTHPSLPFPDETFMEIHAYDVLEHLAAQGDYEHFFAEFSEYWRVLKLGGIFFASVPAASSPWAWGDPSHTRLITPESLTFLQQAEYKKQVGVTKMSDFRYLYKANFEVAFSQSDRDTFVFALKKIKS